MSDAAVLGLDVGGSSLKLGLVAPDGRALAERRIAYPALRDFQHLLDEVAEAARGLEARSGRRAAALGVATPGHARPEDGALVNGTANVPILRGRRLGPLLGERLGLPAATLNDGTAAALGELHHGAGAGLRRFALLTLGTGVGGGVVLDGQPVLGEGGVPPELGAIVLDDAPPPAPRTLEDFASAAGFTRAFARDGGPGGVPPEAIFAAAEGGDPAARAALAATARRIAQGCGALVNALNLEACLIGGGIAEAGEPLRAAVEAALPGFCWPYLLARTSVRLARHRRRSGLLGAAVAARGLLRPG